MELSLQYNSHYGWPPLKPIGPHKKVWRRTHEALNFVQASGVPLLINAFKL